MSYRAAKNFLQRWWTLVDFERPNLFQYVPGVFRCQPFGSYIAVKTAWFDSFDFLAEVQHFLHQTKNDPWSAFTCAEPMRLCTGRGSRTKIKEIGISPISDIPFFQSKRFSDCGAADHREELGYLSRGQNSLLMFGYREIALVKEDEFDASIFAYDYKRRFG